MINVLVQLSSSACVHSDTCWNALLEVGGVDRCTEATDQRRDRQHSDIMNLVKRCWEVKQRQALSCLIAVLSAGRHCPWALCLIFQSETQRDSVERPTLRHDTSRLGLQLVRSKVKVKVTCISDHSDTHTALTRNNW